nr:type IX secretion system protein PorQ [Chryseolinea lacunae]
MLVALTTPAFAQDGVRKSFEFLHMPNNARQAALGGPNVSLADRDLNFFFSNPALSGDSLAGTASASYQFYVASIGQATVAYAHKFKKLGTLNFGVQHLNYGTINGYDATGAPTDDFKSGETVLVVGKSHQVRHFRLGVNVKMAFSNIAGYRASALMMDVGGLFVHPSQDLRVGLAVKNLGAVLSQYSPTSSATLPFDVQLGVTFKPEHMPLRFSITGYNLARRNVIYNDPDAAPGSFDKVLRRLTFGAEVLLHKNVNVLLGYNYLVHQELKLANAGGGAGLSFGFSARIKSVEFVFSRGGYVVGNAGYTFTLSKNIDSLLKRRDL